MLKYYRNYRKIYHITTPFEKIDKSKAFNEKYMKNIQQKMRFL